MLPKIAKVVKLVATFIVLSFVGILAFSFTTTVSGVSEPSARSSERRAAEEWADKADKALKNSNGKEVQFDELHVTHAWNYESRKDPMTSKVIHFATIEANEGLRLRGRDGSQNIPTITVRKNPDSSIDAMVQINRGQFVCRVGGCRLAVRFDDAPALTFDAAEPSDFDSKTLFLLPGNRFLKRLEKAQVVRIEATLFQEGNHVMEFRVAGLKMP